MQADRATYLFDQYVNRTCSPAELQEFMTLIKNADDTAVLDLVMDNFWNKSPEAVLNAGKAEQIIKQVISTDSKFIKKKPDLSRQWLGWAAAFFIICFAAILFKDQNKMPQWMAQTANRPKQVTQSITSLTVKTENEHQKVNLPDGSTVILNNNSSITYPKVFGAERMVTLVGEGYFDIRHDAKKSFTVRAGKLSTKVLGTAFNIKAYTSNRNIEVTVTRGKVSVLDSQSVLGILVPNQQIIFNQKNKRINFVNVLAKNAIQWQESDIFFDDISLEEAAKILSKRFNTPITFANELPKKCRFTATFLKGESLEEILKIICSYNNAQYQTSAGGITINGVGCEP